VKKISNDEKKPIKVRVKSKPFWTDMTAVEAWGRCGKADNQNPGQEPLWINIFDYVDSTCFHDVLRDHNLKITTEAIGLQGVKETVWKFTEIWVSVVDGGVVRWVNGDEIDAVVA
jgi:hypothetical protein